MDKWQELKAYVMDERDRLVAYATTEQDSSCVEQRILRKMAELERSEPAAASVPQGGEFTAAEVEAEIDSLLSVDERFSFKAEQMLRAYACALSSAPGEREGR